MKKIRGTVFEHFFQVEFEHLTLDDCVETALTLIILANNQGLLLEYARNEVVL